VEPTLRLFQDTNPEQIQSNAELDQLYQRYLKNRLITDMFEFRECVFKVALKAFGQRLVPIWYDIQMASPTCSELHRDFLDDTFRFIMTGHRSMDLQTWMALLTIASESGEDMQRTQIAKDVFRLVASESEGLSILHLIQVWMTQCGGFEDMLLSLHILFGVRD
jgi:hypothetical protein